MINDNFLKLIDLLLTKTVNGKAIWNKTSRETEFKLDLEKGSITTDNWNHLDEWFADLRIRNDKGDVVDYISNMKHTEEYNIIMNLYNEVKKSYYKVDETIENIFKELKSDKTVGNRDNDELPF